MKQSHGLTIEKLCSEGGRRKMTRRKRSQMRKKFTSLKNGKKKERQKTK